MGPFNAPNPVAVSGPLENLQIEIPAPKKLYYRFARDAQNNLNLCLADDAGRSSCFVRQ